MRRRIRTATFGLLDQAVVATANAGTTLLGLVLLDREPAGRMVLALGLGYLAMFLNRAFVGDVLIALGSRLGTAERGRLVRDGLTVAALAGLAAGSCLLLASGWWQLRHLIWIVPFLPAVMVHDTVRCAHLAARRPDRALAGGLVWLGTQAAVTTGLLLAADPGPAGLLTAWGLGAVAGAGSYLVRVRPAPGSPRRWLRETRHLAGWFTATAIISQLHVQAINLIVAVRLSPAEVSGLRLGQTVLLQPVQNLIAALQGLLVPWASRTAAQATPADAVASGGPAPVAAPAPAVPASADPVPAGAVAAGAVRRLRRRTDLVALGLGALGVGFVLVAWPLAELVLTRIEKFADVAPLALPLSLQAALYLVQLPYAVALRGMHRARLLCLQYAIASAVGLTGLVSGAWLGRLPGAVWGLLAGTAVGLLVMIGSYRYAVRALTRTAALGQPPSTRPGPPPAKAGQSARRTSPGGP